MKKRKSPPSFTKEHRRKLSLTSTGRKVSLETRKKLSIAHTGKVLSEKTKKRISASKKGVSNLNRRGDKNPMWKGGITGKDKLERGRFRHSIQKDVLERDDYTCQLCGIRGGDLQVDHIQEWSKYVELRFDINNCRTLCVECHYKITYGKPMQKNIKAWGHNLPKGETI